MAGQRKRPSKSAKAGGSADRGTGAEDAERELAGQAHRLLERADELIAERSAWTRGPFARDRHSKPVSPSSDRAVRFCVGGALLRAAHEQFGVEIRVLRPGEKIDPDNELPIPALDEAYRLLGRAMEMFFLQPNGVEVRQGPVADGPRAIVVALPAEPAKAKRELAGTWPALVHTLNDHPRIRHADIRGALSMAQLLIYRESLLGKDADTPKGGRS